MELTCNPFSLSDPLKDPNVCGRPICKGKSIIMANVINNLAFYNS